MSPAYSSWNALSGNARTYTAGRCSPVSLYSPYETGYRAQARRSTLLKSLATPMLA